VQFLQHKFPGQVEQDYRSHLGAFGITGLTGIQKIGTLSGGQKSRVAFAVLSMSRPHILLLDEVSFLSLMQRYPADQFSPVITWISRVLTLLSLQSAHSREELSRKLQYFLGVSADPAASRTTSDSSRVQPTSCGFATTERFPSSTGMFLPTRSSLWRRLVPRRLHRYYVS
jgi:hypothetical protein